MESPAENVRDIWQIDLLGSPEARCGAKTARLRSRRTWCVLAALLLHEQESQSTATQTRHNLIEQFWPDTHNGRVSLRLALASLRENFGDDVLVCAGDTVRIVPERFCCDLFTLEDRYQAACAERALERRILLLEEAVARMRGELLEGCSDPEGSDHLWVTQARAHWNGRCAQILQALCCALEEQGACAEAFEVAARAVRFVPENQTAWDAVWRLARATDRAGLVQTMAEALNPNQQFMQLRARERASLPLGWKQARSFEQLILSRLNSLPEKDRAALLRLSVFTAPFHPEQARQVSNVSLRVLQRLTQAEFLEPTGALFSFLPTLRKVPWSQLPPLAQQRMRDRLVRWASNYVTGYRGRYSFLDVECAKPHLHEARQRLLELPLTVLSLQIMNMMRAMGVGDPDQQVQLYLERTARDSTQNISLRHTAALNAGITAINSYIFLQAIPLLELALTLSSPEVLPWQMANVHFHLAFAYHHAEFIELARFHAECACTIYKNNELIADQSHATRFLGEILRRQGNLSESETALREALALAHTVYGSGHALAEFYYQLGVTLTALHCHQEASATLQAALQMRFESGAAIGIADCLSALGALKTEQGRYLEARVDLEYAIVLYQQNNNLPAAAATKGAMGDLFARQGQRETARKYYAEGLDFWRNAGHTDWTASFEKRLEALNLQSDA